MRFLQHLCRAVRSIKSLFQRGISGRHPRRESDPGTDHWNIQGRITEATGGDGTLPIVSFFVWRFDCVVDAGLLELFDPATGELVFSCRLELVREPTVRRIH